MVIDPDVVVELSGPTIGSTEEGASRGVDLGSIGVTIGAGSPRLTDESIGLGQTPPLGAIRSVITSSVGRNWRRVRMAVPLP
jgi:hypothetical protein